MPEPDALADAVRRVLVDVARRRSTITYEALLDLVPGAGIRDVDLAPVLRAVSVASDDDGRGLLTALVVRSDGGLPGGGFFRLAADRGRDVGDRRSCWEAEVARVWAAHAPS